MNINELNILATQLPELTINGVSKECLIRSSVSKHYYEIFHKVRIWLIQHFPTIFNDCGGGTHQQLRTCFELLNEKINDQKFQMISLKLKVLHTLRTNADYQIDSDFRAGNLMTLISEKKRVFELLDVLSNEYSSNNGNQKGIL